MIIKMARSDAITGLTLPPDTQISAEQCHPCAAEKLKCCTFNLSSPPKSTRIDMLISCDLWTPAQTPSLGGAICCSTFCDHCSDYRAAHYLKFKDEVAGSVLDFIRLLHTQMGQLGCVKLQCLACWFGVIYSVANSCLCAQYRCDQCKR